MDWIGSFLELTEGLPTPAVFRLWSGIFAVAACLERRCWLRTAFGTTYPNLFILLAAPSGSGKCLHPDQQLLTFDGDIVRARDVYEGQQLLGPDSEPRQVLSISHGHGKLYRITPVKGKQWICNGAHILSLKRTGGSDVCFVSVEEWLTWSNNQKAMWKLWRSGVVKFSYRDRPEISPYFVGVMLGDGEALRYRGSICVTSIDPEIIAALEEEAAFWGLTVKRKNNYTYRLSSTEWHHNALAIELRKYGLTDGCADKSIPDHFKCGSIETRRELLAGILDTDGSLGIGCYDYISKSPQLANDVAFVARSLGLAAYIKRCTKGCMYKGEMRSNTYWRVSISGDTDKIPCRVERKKAKPREQIKSALKTGFTVEPLIEGDWVGFEIDGDKQFLLDDFTVTHNSPAIAPARALLYKSKTVVMAADDMTKAAFVDEMGEHTRRVLYKGETILYNPLCIMITELGTLVNAHDLEFFSLLSDLFDNKEVPHRSRRRGHNSGKAIDLPNPSVNIIAGTQPAFLGDLLPDAAWQQGFTARFLMIYAPGAPAADMFAEREDQSQLQAELVKGLQVRSKLLGEFKISEEAKDIIRLWMSSGLKPVPDHERLTTYNSKRNQFVLKLAMIAAVSERGDLHITAADVERGKSWLLAAEHVMPDIFRDMVQRSDGALIGELHRFAWNMWLKSAARSEQRKLIHRSKLMEFLSLRCPADKAMRILELACQMGWIEQQPDSLLFLPKARGLVAAEE